MGRPPGARNDGFDARRRELARRALESLTKHRGQASLRDMAREAEVSIPTLKHYFGDREGAVAEALRTAREGAEPHLQRTADPGRRGLKNSLETLAQELAVAWSVFGVGPMFAAGMVAGMFDGKTGPAYLDGVLEPTVLAIEARLRVHARRGEAALDPDDEHAVRTAALAFVSPLLVALLHQNQLFGRSCRPLDLDRFIATHVDGFVRAWGTKAP